MDNRTWTLTGNELPKYFAHVLRGCDRPSTLPITAKRTPDGSRTMGTVNSSLINFSLILTVLTNLHKRRNGLFRLLVQLLCELGNELRLREYATVPAR